MRRIWTNPFGDLGMKSRQHQVPRNEILSPKADTSKPIESIETHPSRATTTRTDLGNLDTRHIWHLTRLAHTTLQTHTHLQQVA